MPPSLATSPLRVPAILGLVLLPPGAPRCADGGGGEPRGGPGRSRETRPWVSPDREAGGWHLGLPRIRCGTSVGGVEGKKPDVCSGYVVHVAQQPPQVKEAPSVGGRGGPSANQPKAEERKPSLPGGRDSASIRQHQLLRTPSLQAGPLPSDAPGRNHPLGRHV